MPMPTTLTRRGQASSGAQKCRPRAPPCSVWVQLGDGKKLMSWEESLETLKKQLGGRSIELKEWSTLGHSICLF